MPDDTTPLQIWWCFLDGHGVQDLPELLDTAEPTTRQRLESLRFEADRAAVLVAHALARLAAAHGVGATDPRTVRIARTCTTCGSSEHGRPEAYVGDSRRGFLSISHTRRIAAVAFGSGDAVGVDAEDAVLHDWSEDLASVFSASERAQVAGDPTGRVGRTYWVRKEALVKLHGVGIVVPLAQVEVGAVPETGGRVDGPAPGWVRDVPTGAEGYAVAVASARELPITAHEITIDDLRAAWSG